MRQDHSSGDLTQNLKTKVGFIVLINNEPKLTSTLAAGIVPYAFA